MCHDAEDPPNPIAAALLHTIVSLRPSSAVPALASIALGDHHFNQIQRNTGLSSSTLANALKRLQDLRIVTRHEDGTYALSRHFIRQANATTKAAE